MSDQKKEPKRFDWKVEGTPKSLLKTLSQFSNVTPPKQPFQLQIPSDLEQAHNESSVKQIIHNFEGLTRGDQSPALEKEIQYSDSDDTISNCGSEILDLEIEDIVNQEDLIPISPDLSIAHAFDEDKDTKDDWPDSPTPLSELQSDQNLLPNDAELFNKTHLSQNIESWSESPIASPISSKIPVLSNLISMDAALTSKLTKMRSQISPDSTPFKKNADTRHLDAFVERLTFIYKNLHEEEFDCSHEDLLYVGLCSLLADIKGNMLQIDTELDVELYVILIRQNQIKQLEELQNEQKRLFVKNERQILDIRQEKKELETEKLKFKQEQQDFQDEKSNLYQKISELENLKKKNKPSLLILFSVFIVFVASIVWQVYYGSRIDVNLR